MEMREKKYQFREEMLRFHRKDLAEGNVCPPEGAFVFRDAAVIYVREDADEVLMTGALDLRDYLFESMRVSVIVKPVRELPEDPEGAVLIGVPGDFAAPWDGADVPASVTVTATERNVRVFGFDGRGCAQGCYRLEDMMTRVRAPYVPAGEKRFVPVFSPRMVHSGYGLDQFPDAHLSAIAHAGMDAILVFVKDVNVTPFGFMMFNELIYRAAKYGIDVYAYSYFVSEMHPDEEGAFEHYDGMYGKLFRECPGIKGVILVGESVEFPSKDPRVSNLKYYNNKIDGIPTGKPTAGWFPCNDYDRWLRMLQRVICPAKPDADIVFWTYNWSSRPKEERFALIDSLPEGITLMATFEMGDLKMIDDVKVRPSDYTISFPGPGPYFASEAQRAKERGIRLYTQANSGGLTWDWGDIPYEPFPGQWILRYQAMLKANRDWGLSGIMESHHFGFWPSFISEIETRMFTEPDTDADTILRETAEELAGKEHAEQVLSAWEDLDTAIRYYPCSDEDQYGAFRIGPSYPFIFRWDVEIPTVPYAHFGGNRICFTDYASDPLYRITSGEVKECGFVRLRLKGHIRCLRKMLDALRSGREKLEAVLPSLTGVRRADLARLVNMIAFMEHSAVTVVNVKEWTMCRWNTQTLETMEEQEENLLEMIKIGRRELLNAEETIPIVEADSRLGWEPSMEYIGDAEHIRWKIRQLTQVIEEEIPVYQRAVRRYNTIEPGFRDSGPEGNDPPTA